MTNKTITQKKKMNGKAREVAPGYTKKSPKTPPLRFRGFDGAWEEKKLGEVASFSKGKGLAKKDVVNDGKNECIRYGELYTTYSEIIDSIVSKTNLKKEKCILSEKDDLLIPSSGETNIDIATVSCVKKKDIILGGDLNIVKLKGDNFGDFFAYYLSNYKKRDIARFGQGHSVVHLYSTHFKNLKISLPSKDEQGKIAGFLSAVDEWLENLKEQKCSYERYKKGLMQKLFPTKEQSAPSLRLSGFSGDWEEKKLGEVCEIIMGQSPDSKFYNNNGDGDILVQGNADIQNRKVVPRLWTTQITKKAKYTDLIMTVRAPVGHIAKTNVDCVLGRGVCAIRAVDASKEFIYQVLLKKENSWRKFEQGSTFSAVNSKDIKNFKIKLPPLPEQEKIAKLLSSIDDIIEKTETKIIQAEQWKKGLMQRLFV